MILLALLLPQAPETIVIQGHRDASEAVVGTAAMRYLPFDVPPGTTSVEIEPEILDRDGDRDTVDLGLFDSHGTGPEGFRGWQGGTRQRAILTGDPRTTSPWIVAGPIPAGRWSLAQYYLKASSKGLDYRYRITFHFDGPRPPKRTPSIRRPTEAGLDQRERWYAGNLHTHTLSSDGKLSMPELMVRNRQAGFDFVVSTEHNTTGGHWLLADAARQAPGLLPIEGTEITTPGGHANVYGGEPGHWFDFRTQPDDGGLPKAIADVHRHDGIFVVNHPYALCTSCPWRFPQDEWQAADGIEVWNGAWDFTDEAALRLWDGLLRTGRRINAYGGSDYHRDPDRLTPATRVWAKGLSHASILDALRRGRTIMTDEPTGASLDVWVEAKGRCARPGEEIDGAGTLTLHLEAQEADGAKLTVRSARGAEGEPILVQGLRFSRVIPLSGSGLRYVRVELRKPDGRMLALSNAIWVR